MADEHILSQEELDALLGNGEEGGEASLEGHTLGEAFRVVLRAAGEALGRLSGADITFAVTGVLDSMAAHELPAGAYEVLYAVSGDVYGRLHLYFEGAFVEALVRLLNDGEAGDQDELSEVLGEAMQVAGGALCEALADLLSADVAVAVERTAPFDVEEGAALPADAVALQMSVRLGDMDPTSGYVVIPESVAEACVELIMDAAQGAAEDPEPGEEQPAAGDTPVSTPVEPRGKSAVRSREKESATFRPAEFAPLRSPSEEPGAADNNLDLLLDVPLRVTVELGRTTMQIRDILDLRKGQVIELDKLAGEPVDVFVNAKLIAKGEVVVMDEHFGVRITHIVSRHERVQNLK